METVQCTIHTKQEVPPVPAKRVYKKRKQTTEDKRKRNYIAVRKHRQQLKDTLENCPVELVQLKKKMQTLDSLFAENTKMLDNFKEMAKLVEKRRKLPEEELKKLTVSEKPRSPKPESPSLSTISTITTNTATEVSESQSTTSPALEKRRRITPPTSLSSCAPMSQLLLPPLLSFNPRPNLFQLPNMVSDLSPLVPQESLPMPFSPLFSPLYNASNLFNFPFPFSQPISFPTSQAGPSNPQLAMSQDTVDALWRLCNQGLNS